MKKQYFLLTLLVAGTLLAACGETTTSSSTLPSQTDTSQVGVDDIPEEVLTLLKAATGNLEGEYKKDTFTPTETLLEKYSLTIDGTLKAVIYKGSVKATGYGIPVDQVCVAYVGVDATTFKILGYEIDGEPVTSWQHAEDFDAFADSFVGTTGTVSGVTGASASSDAYIAIAKAAVAQARVDAGQTAIEPLEFHIDDTLTSVASKAYQNRTDITKVYIPASITSIGTNAFDGCTNLEEVVYEDASQTNVIKIGNNAFKNCSSLTTIGIEMGNVGMRSFSGCSSLTSIAFNGTSSSYAFENCSSLQTVSFGVKGKYGANMFAGCKALKTINAEKDENGHTDIVTDHSDDGYDIIFGTGKIGYIYNVTATEPVVFTFDAYCTNSVSLYEDYAFENLQVSKYALMEEGTYKADAQGLLIKNGTRIAGIPNAYEGVLHIDSDIVGIDDDFVSPYLEEVTVQGREYNEDGEITKNENKFYASERGFLYASYEYESGPVTDRSEIFFVNRDTAGAVMINEETIRLAPYAFAYTDVDSIYIPREAGVKFEVDPTTFLGVKSNFKIYFSSETYIKDYQNKCNNSEDGWTPDMLSYISTTPYVAA